MSKDIKNIIIVFINYLLLVGFLGLGGYLYVNYPENEVLGGMVLGSTGVILGIIFNSPSLATFSLSLRVNPQFPQVSASGARNAPHWGHRNSPLNPGASSFLAGGGA